MRVDYFLLFIPFLIEHKNVDINVNIRIKCWLEILLKNKIPAPLSLS